MVSASEAITALRIPRASFYRALKDGRIPVHEERQLWRKRPVRRFNLTEIREALKMEPLPPSLSDG